MMKTLLTLLVSILFSINLAAQAPSNYYSDAQGSSGFQLKTALYIIIDDIDDNNGQPSHDAQGYGDLWDVYEDSDSRIENGNVFVFDMYSDCDFEFVIDQNMGNNGGECFNFNREHSFPRSWFDNTGLDIYTDPFHVIPTDSRVNNNRGNLAYGEVANASFTSTNGSQIGTSALTGPTDDVFEPVDEFKGDIARQFFYVATRYENLIGNWEANNTNGDSMLDGSNDRVFEDWALQMLFEWHTNDPVSTKELVRQEAIFDFQGNRNPFIDNPQWVAEIWGNTLSNEEFTKQDVTVFPNPLEGNILSFQLSVGSKATIAIYSILGKRVISNTTTTHQFNMNLSNLSAGIYLVRVQQGNNSSTLKLIKP